jgi:hypothetical protein
MKWNQPLVTACLAIVVMTAMMWWSAAFGHDSWINRGNFHNALGEPCCGEHDCFVLPSRQVSERRDGYHIWIVQIIDGKEQMRAEIVPYAEAQFSRDGQFWRCRRPDGSRRCFFRPPNSS